MKKYHFIALAFGVVLASCGGGECGGIVISELIN